MHFLAHNYTSEQLKDLFNFYTNLHNHPLLQPVTSAARPAPSPLKAGKPRPLM
jgi:hypothetical protein